MKLTSTAADTGRFTTANFKIQDTYLLNIVGESIEDAMEGENGDPYEEQLLAVFESCLEKGRSELSSEGLRALCDKLQLEERSRLLISLLSPSHGDASVTFATFRDGLLKLLGQREGSPCHFGEVERSDDSAATDGATSRVSRRKVSKDKSSASTSGRDAAETNGENSEMRDSSVIGYASLRKQMPPERIFAKLDSDGDGLISLDEFVVLFEDELATNGAWSEVAKALDEERSPVRVLGAQQTGYARMSTIVGMWEVAGVSDAAILLSDLGFTSSEINLGDLTSVLCEELKNLRDEPPANDATSTHTSLLKGALTLYQEEVRCITTLVEHLRGERDKLRIDVAEANERANLLAQEIDEHHARLEKSRQDQLKQLELRHSEITRNLSIRCSLEREAHTAASRALDEQLRAVQQEEQQVRAKLADVLQENQSLENEVEKLCDQVTKLKTSNAQLLMKIQHLAAEHEEVEESNNSSEESQQIIQLIERIKRLQEEIALLRDQNDELTTELEFTKNRMHERPLDCAATDDDDDDETVESRDGIELAGSLDNFVNEPRSVSTSSLPQTFLDPVATNNEDDECEERASESLRDLVVARSETSKLVRCKSHSNDTIETSVNNFETKSSSATRNRTSGLRDYPPRREESMSPEVSKTDMDAASSKTARQENLGTDEVEAAKDAIGKKQLIDRCAELERSLDLLRSEYEECEDYWAGKLEEERQIFEQEQKISDDKFSELIAKIAEYEEQFGPGEKPSTPSQPAPPAPPALPRNDGRLSPIEEKFYLEQQYTDLEDEYERFRTRTRQALSHRDNEIKELQEKLSKRRASTDATTQVSDNEGAEERGETNETSSPNSPPPPPLPSSHPSSVESHPSAVLTCSPSKKLLRYDPASVNRKLFDHNKFNEICEGTDSIDAIPSAKLGECYCQQIEAYNSMEELCRLHKAELHRLYRKKLEIDNECVSLARQKETLIKGVSDLKNVTLVKRFCTPEDEDEAANCGLSINILKTLNDRLQAQEKKRRNLKMSLVHQQQQAERILQQTWQQHCQEVAALHFALQATKEQLKRQLEINHEQAERLAKADILSTDLYVQNAHLMASVKRLEQHCHILAQFGGESTSV